MARPERVVGARQGAGCEGGIGTPLTAVVASAPPNETRDAVLGGLEQCTPDGLGQSGIVNLDAQVGLFGTSLGLAPSGTDLGGPHQDPELWRSLAVPVVVSEHLYLAVQSECADGAGVTILDGSEGSNHGHGKIPPMMSG